MAFRNKTTVGSAIVIIIVSPNTTDLKVSCSVSGGVLGDSMKKSLEKMLFKQLFNTFFARYKNHRSRLAYY